MPDTNVQYLQGVDTVAFARVKSKEGTEEAKLIPWQTALSFDPSRSTDSNPTKSGSVSTSSSLETELSVELINNTSSIVDNLWDSLIDGTTVEVWIVHLKRLNATGQHYAWYMQAGVSENSNDNDSDDNSTLEVTFSVNGTPKRGWLTLPASAQQEIDYIFRGLGAITESDKTGAGVEWKSTDAGQNAPEKK